MVLIKVVAPPLYWFMAPPPCEPAVPLAALPLSVLLISVGCRIETEQPATKQVSRVVVDGTLLNMNRAGLVVDAAAAIRRVVRYGDGCGSADALITLKPPPRPEAELSINAPPIMVKEPPLWTRTPPPEPLPAVLGWTIISLSSAVPPSMSMPAPLSAEPFSTVMAVMVTDALLATWKTRIAAGVAVAVTTDDDVTARAVDGERAVRDRDRALQQDGEIIGKRNRATNADAVLRRAANQNHCRCRWSRCMYSRCWSG